MPEMYANRRNFRVLKEIWFEEHDGDFSLVNCLIAKVSDKHNQGHTHLLISISEEMSKHQLINLHTINKKWSV